MKLLEALGGECAGTVAFNSEEEPPLQLRTEYELSDECYAPVSDRDISGLIDQMESVPLVFSRRDFRLSLAGAQQKIALAHFGGKWFIPKGGAPSTHIIKPAQRDFLDIARNEYLSMRLGGIFIGDVASPSMVDFCGKEAFCVRWFDRIQDGGPSVGDICRLLSERSSDPIADMRKLLGAVIFQFLIGNCDVHGKNFSLLEDKDSVALGPAYDVVSTAIYPSLTRKLAMKIGNEYELDRICRRHFIELADRFGVRISAVNKVLEGFEKRMPEAEAFLKGDKVALESPKLASAIWEGFLARWRLIV